MKSIFQRTLLPPWIALLLFVLLGTAAAAGWFLATHEKKSYTVNSGASFQARHNPLLAAALFLREIGHESESLNGLELLFDLPPADDAILSRRLPAGMSEKLTADLLAWVSRGGHLLAVPRSLESDHPGHTSLLERLGAGFMEDQSDCGCPPKTPSTAIDRQNGDTAETKKSPQTEATAEAATEAATEAVPAQREKPAEPDPQGPFHTVLHPTIGEYAVELETFRPRLLKDLSDQAVISLDGSYVIDYELEADKTRSDHGMLKQRQGAWLLQYTHGRGKVTFLSEMNLFHNQQIGNYDHAFFLSWLTREDQKIWLIHSTGVESILAIIWKFAPRFWITLAVTITLLLWKLQLRSGTPGRTAPTGSRNVLDHIEATAQFGWRTDRLDGMLKTNRKTILTLWRRRTTGNTEAVQENDGDLNVLAERCNIHPQEVYSAFHGKADTEETLIRTSRTLQRIRQLITAGVQRKP